MKQGREARRTAAAQRRRQRSAKRWMGANITLAADGAVLVADTQQERASAFAAYDGSIAMEKRGHIISDGGSWNDEWLNVFRNIRKSSENPEVLIAYIVSHRRAAGLPELECEPDEEHGRD